MESWGIQELKTKTSMKPCAMKEYSKEKSMRIANTPNSNEKEGKSEDYENRTKEKLMDKAQEVEIKERSKMHQDELIHALRNN